VREEKPELAAKGVEEYDYVVGAGALQTARWRHGFLSAIPSVYCLSRLATDYHGSICIQEGQPRSLVSTS
jgi:hypothetical protein